MKTTFYTDVSSMFDSAANSLELPDGLSEKIRVCKATYVTRFGVRLRCKMHTFTGWRAVHSNGPITFAADKALRERGVVIIPGLFANAGGVVVSYFEWVKNLTHIPFGLMERRYDEKGHRTLARSLEAMTWQAFPKEAEDEFFHRRTEIDLARSGLDDMMRSTYAELSRRWNDPGDPAVDLRSAAYAVSINRIAEADRAIGI